MMDVRDIIAQQDEQGIAHGALVDDAARSFGDRREFFSIADEVTRNQAASDRIVPCFDIIGAVGIHAVDNSSRTYKRKILVINYFSLTYSMGERSTQASGPHRRAVYFC
jgi:hypothetical protein